MQVVDKNVDRRPAEVRAAADAFVQFLFTPECQREFAACGFRSILPHVGEEFPMPAVQTTWRVDEALGGWEAAQNKFFADGAIADQIQKAVGELRRGQKK